MTTLTYDCVDQNIRANGTPMYSIIGFFDGINRTHLTRVQNTYDRHDMYSKFRIDAELEDGEYIFVEGRHNSKYRTHICIKNGEQVDTSYSNGFQVVLKNEKIVA